jgi:hypothetical protein
VRLHQVTTTVAAVVALAQLAVLQAEQLAVLAVLVRLQVSRAVRSLALAAAEEVQTV